MTSLLDGKVPNYGSEIIFVGIEQGNKKGIKYSADKINYDKKSKIVVLVGNAEVILGKEKVTGQKIVLNLKTGEAGVTGIAKFTSDNMKVQLLKKSATKN